MPANRYERSVLPYLDRVERWAKQGGTIKEICGKLHISVAAFSGYLSKGRAGDERYAALIEAWERATAVADDDVEAALFKRACGYQFEEITSEQKLTKEGTIVELRKSVRRDVAPDTEAAKFWLANRRRDKWSYKPDGALDDGEGGDGKGVVVLAPIMEAEQPPDGVQAAGEAIAAAQAQEGGADGQQQ